MDADQSAAAAPAKRLLAIFQHILSPRHNGHSHYLLDLLAAFGEVNCTVDYLPYEFQVWPPDPARISEDIQLMEDAGLHVLQPPEVSSIADYLVRCGHQYDIVLLWPEAIASKTFRLVKQYAPQATVIYNTIELSHIRLFREAKVTGNIPNLRRALEVKQQMIWLAQHADCTLVVSELERQALLELCPDATVKVIPHPVKTIVDTPPSFADRHGLLFVGYYGYLANTDAMLYFIDKILPFIRQTIPDIKLYVVGSAPPSELEALATESIIVTGHVPDLEPYFDQARLSIAPIRYGAGVKNKVLMSMGRALPVVTTSIAAEGMYLENGVNTLIADRPEEFASAVIRLYQDEALWSRLSAAAMATIEQHFSTSALHRVLLELLSLVKNS